MLNMMATLRYNRLTVADLMVKRRAKTVFVFGSGASLNAIPPAEWARMEAFDTFGFSWFVYQRFVRMDFALLRELAIHPDARIVRTLAAHYGEVFSANRRFQDTVLLVQGGWRAIAGNYVLGLRSLRPGAPVFRFDTAGRGCLPPSESLDTGLVHGPGTLTDAINAAYLLGWERIVLVGVDLYDRRYFWLPPDVGDVLSENVRGGTVSDEHNTVRNGIIALLGDWRSIMGAKGVSLEVYNPRSLLAEVLPVFRWEAVAG